MSDASPRFAGGIGLSAFIFFMACVQTGFGPFLPVYLTQSGWTQGAVGFALSLGAIASVASQVPAGALVDQVLHKKLVCAVCIGAVGLGALILALWPGVISVWGAITVHAFAAAALTPAIAALSLSLCGENAFGQRVGDNARYASLGNAAAAALLGFVAYRLSDRAVFFLAAAMTLPALGALLFVPQDHAAPRNPHPALSPPRARNARSWHIFFELHMHTFAVCITLFTLANAAMLPLALNSLATHHQAAGLATTGSIIALQIVVVVFAPRLGWAAERWGRWPVLVVGFAALPLRGLLFAMTPGPVFLIAIEVLDGVSAAVIGVMIPLIAADLTRKTGFLNLAIGSFGLAASLGATFSTTVAGWIADRFGLPVAFLALAAAGGLALLVVIFIMPETAPRGIARNIAPEAA